MMENRCPTRPRNTPWLMVLVVASVVAIGPAARASDGDEQSAPQDEPIVLSIDDAVQLAVIQAAVLSRHNDRARSASEDVSLAASYFEPQLGLGVTRRHSEALSADATQTTTVDVVRSDGQDFDIGMSVNVPGGGQVSMSWGQDMSSTDALDALLGQSYGRRLVLTLRQPLLDGAIFDAGTDALLAAQSNRRITWWALRDQVAALIQDAENVYWAVVQAQADLQSAEDSLTFALHQRDLTKERVDEGFLAPVEMLQVEEQVTRSQATRQSAVANLESTRDAMRTLLMFPLDDWQRPIVLTTVPAHGTDQFLEPGEELLGASLELALEHNANYQIALEEHHRKREALRAKATSLLPDLNFTANLWRSGLGGEPDEALDALASGESVGWSIGLDLSMGLMLTRDRIEFIRAKRSVHLSETALESARLELEQRVRAAVRNLELARTNLELAILRRDFATRKLTAEEERLEHGQTTVKTLMDYLADRDLATRQESAAAITVLKALVHLQRVRGDLLSERSIALEDIVEIAPYRNRPIP